MPLVTRTKSSLIVVFLIVSSLLTVGFGLFSGRFDHGQYAIEQVQWISPGSAALIAKRSDHDALNSDQHFVLIANHQLTAKELRTAYYHDGVIFRASTECLRVQWESPQKLIVTCFGGSIRPTEIAVQKHRSGDVDVLYRNIPEGAE